MRHLLAAALITVALGASAQAQTSGPRPYNELTPNAAVPPPTKASVSVPSSTEGIVSLRRELISSSVSISCGDVIGMTEMMAVSPDSLN